jgi:hypothetical protein
MVILLGLCERLRPDTGPRPALTSWRFICAASHWRHFSHSLCVGLACLVVAWPLVSRQPVMRTPQTLKPNPLSRFC